MVRNRQRAARRAIAPAIQPWRAAARAAAAITVAACVHLIGVAEAMNATNTDEEDVGITPQFRREYTLAVLAATGYVNRFLQGTLPVLLLKKLVCKLCCGGRDPTREALVNSGRTGGEAMRGYTMNQMQLEACPWDEARRKLGYVGEGRLRDMQGKCTALSVSAIRLFLWHLIQPAVYITSLVVYWDTLDGTQRGLGAAVGVREGMYAAFVLWALFDKPAFLLVDVRATWESDEGGGVSVLMYVLMPEKFVIFNLVRDRDGPRGRFLGFTGCLNFILDFVAVAALIVGLKQGDLPLALAIGYSAPALAAVLLICILVGNAAYQLCCKRHR